MRPEDPVETAVRRAWERIQARERMHPVIRQSVGARLIEEAMQREVDTERKQPVQGLPFQPVKKQIGELDMTSRGIVRIGGEHDL